MMTGSVSNPTKFSVSNDERLHHKVVNCDMKLMTYTNAVATFNPATPSVQSSGGLGHKTMSTRRRHPLR